MRFAQQWVRAACLVRLFNDPEPVDLDLRGPGEKAGGLQRQRVAGAESRARELVSFANIGLDSCDEVSSVVK